ncbi:MAG TPA: PspC domain-containing protein [Firmicutes bacterium]|nr:PspC domain-containing protein [Bacillota bacterium]
MGLFLSKNKMIAGVCGGIAERFSLELSLVRIGAVLLLLLFRLPVLVIYILLWILLPREV